MATPIKITGICFDCGECIIADITHPKARKCKWCGDFIVARPRKYGMFTVKHDGEVKTVRAISHDHAIRNVCNVPRSATVSFHLPTDLKNHRGDGTYQVVDRNGLVLHSNVLCVQD